MRHWDVENCQSFAPLFWQTNTLISSIYINSSDIQSKLRKFGSSRPDRKLTAGSGRACCQRSPPRQRLCGLGSQHSADRLARADARGDEATRLAVPFAVNTHGIALV
eukprot:6175049-Pleurochrysis_carterae.AAC.7